MIILAPRCGKACFAGKNPHWREEQWHDRGGPPCGWKDPGEVGDSEHRMLEMIREAVNKR